jgi:hypothetical protein
VVVGGLVGGRIDIGCVSSSSSSSESSASGANGFRLPGIVSL